MIGQVAAGETLCSVAHVSSEQRDRARRYVEEEAELRYPEEDQAVDRQEWLGEMLSVLGLHDPAS
jgi:hypothetical protein